MIENRVDKESSKKDRYISYALLLGFMIGFHYLSERNVTNKKHNEGITVLQKKSIYMMPQTAGILNDIYDINICGKYYRADALCNKIIRTFSDYDGKEYKIYQP